MRQHNICDVGRPGQTHRCKCGHLKDEHVRDSKGNLQCQRYIFSEEANMMVQCGCKI